MQNTNKSRLLLVGVSVLVSLCWVKTSFGMRTSNRVMQFLVQPREFFGSKRSEAQPALFFTTASKADNRDGGDIGIPELEGQYNLKTMIQALELYNADLGQVYTNPLEALSPTYVDKDLVYRVDGKVRSFGVMLEHDQMLYKSFVSVGFSLPILYFNTLSRTVYSQQKSNDIFKNLTEAEFNQIEVVRRQIQEALGLGGNLWSTTGIGDLDLHATLHGYAEHRFLLKSIQASVRLGCMVPTGFKREQQYISSLPIMNDGHWGLYGTMGVNAELKQNLKLGLMMSWLWQIKRVQHDRQISVYQEATYVSPLAKNISVQPGYTFSVAPFLTLENLMDGVHFQVKYTYLRHGNDSLYDITTEDTPASYLTRGISDGITDKNLTDLRETKKRNSGWRNHYMTFQVTYDSKEAMKNWWFSPDLFASYDYPLGGRGVANNHQLTVGVGLHF